jgi:hypothetical protein
LPYGAIALLRGCPRPDNVVCWRDEMPVKVKICGITNLADALGFVFYDQSPRGISVETAAVRDESGFFVNAPEDCSFMVMNPQSIACSSA